MFEMNQEFFDSRDLIARLEELETMEELALDVDATQEDVDEWTRDLDDELASLRKFADEANHIPDWECGELRGGTSQGLLHVGCSRLGSN